MSTQTAAGTDTTPQTSRVNQCGVTPWHGSDPTASPVTPHLPGNDANAHPALADLS